MSLVLRKLEWTSKKQWILEGGRGGGGGGIWKKHVVGARIQHWCVREYITCQHLEFRSLYTYFPLPVHVLLSSNPSLVSLCRSLSLTFSQLSYRCNFLIIGLPFCHTFECLSRGQSSLIHLTMPLLSLCFPLHFKIPALKVNKDKREHNKMREKLNYKRKGGSSVRDTVVNIFPILNPAVNLSFSFSFLLLWSACALNFLMFFSLYVLLCCYLCLLRPSILPSLSVFLEIAILPTQLSHMQTSIHLFCSFCYQLILSHPCYIFVKHYVDFYCVCSIWIIDLLSKGFAISVFYVVFSTMLMLKIQ